MEAQRTRVAVLFGGRSSEHAISCVSAGGILRSIDRSRYDVVPIGITRSGSWRRRSDDPASLAIVGGRLPEVSSTGDRVVLSLDPGRRGFWLYSGMDSPTWHGIDVVFPVLHGVNGEDGSIQGAFEIAGMPYVGSGVLASAVCMDKGHAKTIMASAGLPVGRWHVFHVRQWRAAPELQLSVLSGLGSPLFVKPARAGSSVGVSKASTPKDLERAIALALRHDPRVIVESSVERAQEIECGVLVGPDGVVRASVPAEISVRGAHEFYDFEAKYLDEGADLKVPADLSAATAKSVRELAVRAFEALGCEGLARVDFFVGPDGAVIVNEVNTMPGFTPISMYPRMWSESGVPYPELIDTLLREAMARGPGLR